MLTVKDILTPRDTVFSDTTREDVLNLTDFIDDKIDDEKFFDENFQTNGMSLLFDTAFARFNGESDTGVIKLTQAMGGGKTHNMLALALLAKNENLRNRLFDLKYSGIGEIKVVAFSGRENADYGIWGSIAEQLGKKELFKDYYSPLKAPGERSWINLLQGEKILILLDELPPYLENAKSIAVGNSDLSKVTMTALSTLFTALGKAELANVCLVFSDLKAAYESGSELLQSSFKELEAEANRVAIEITPVALNSDEIYNILQKRLFENIDWKANEENINNIARSYKECVEKTKKLTLTNYAPEAVFVGIKESYPFHPSIKDLYARFKENQNFQQTRGLIKLMRQIVRQFYESGMAHKNYLINVFDFNLNNPTMLSHIQQINPTLIEAISHDIAQNGRAIAEIIDGEQAENLGIAQEVAKLLLVSSLSTVQHGLLGLSDSDILGYLSAPNKDINLVKSCFEELKASSWYIKQDNKGRTYFQKTKNMVAELNTLVDSYTNANAKKELKVILEDCFKPTTENCYQKLYVLPAVDEINLDLHKISLIIYEPYSKSELHPDLAAFYENTSLKNRVMFLSGQRNMMEKLYENSKKLKAIQQILANMKLENISTSDQQHKSAEEHLIKAKQALLSTIRETFVTLYYPSKNGIESVDFRMEFKENRFDGEEQIIKTLIDRSKYEPFSRNDLFLETLRKKCEERLFTVKELPFSQIKERAATNSQWQWYHPEQLDTLMKECLNSDKWRETGGYLVKGPFEKEPTSVKINQTGYDENTNEFILKIQGVGGKVYYDIGADPTVASTEVASGVLKTKEPCVRFICIDPTGERKTGEVNEFLGKAPLKFGQRATPKEKFVTLETHPDFIVKFTTDGSEPKENGGIYNHEFAVNEDCRYVRAAVFLGEKLITETNFGIEHNPNVPKQFNIDSTKPLTFKYKSKKEMGDTEESYRELSLLSKLKDVKIKGSTITLYNRANDEDYIEISASIPHSSEDLKAILELIRDTSFKDKDTLVTFGYNELQFETGDFFNKWVEINKMDLNDLAKSGVITQ